MITTTAREIIRNAEDLSNSTNSAYLDFTLKTSILNREYRKLYDQIVQNSNDFTKTITLSGGKHILPEDCYLIVSVHNGSQLLTRSSMNSKFNGEYSIENNYIKLPLGGNYKLTYSILPPTITAPDKAIKLNQEDIPTDNKSYFVEYNDGICSFKENNTNKYLGKSFNYDLSTEKTNGAWRVNNVFYNDDLTEMKEEPVGQITDEREIGKITIDDTNWYYRDKITETNTVYESNGIYYNENFEKIKRPEGELKEHTSVGLFKKVFHKPTVVNVFSDGTNLYNSLVEVITEPSYTNKYEPTSIGVVRSYDNKFYQRKAENWFLVTGFSTKNIYTDYNQITDQGIISALNAANDITINYIKYEQGTLLNYYIYKMIVENEPVYRKANSITEYSELINDQFDIAYLNTLTFDEYFEDKIIDYSNYYKVIGFILDKIEHEKNYITDIEEIERLDQIEQTEVYCLDFIEQIDQKIIWDEEDVLPIFDRAAPRTEEERKEGIKKDITIVNIQYHSPYCMVSYSDGVILIYTGFDKAVWNYNCITGHDTLGKIIALKTDDRTGKGCVWYNEEDGEYYYASFVPDTILNYPISALYTLLEYRIAAILCGLLSTENNYLTQTLLPEAEQNFYSTLHYGNVASPMDNYLPKRRWF